MKSKSRREHLTNCDVKNSQKLISIENYKKRHTHTYFYRFQQLIPVRGSRFTPRVAHGRAPREHATRTVRYAAIATHTHHQQVSQILDRNLAQKLTG